ncbi:MAG: HAD family hydrolase [Solirubrobacterales bacterium]|nr:HAD family hydrolase [Solirubrobacterales bacterium]
MPARQAVFLDRDGTINVRAPDHDYIRDVADFRWLPGALEGMVTLARAGLPLFVVSNQRGVSRGLVTDATLTAIEACIRASLQTHGCSVEAFRYCCHDLDAQCDCRKPRPGLLLAVAREYQLDLASCWMIGDSVEDVEAGLAAGCRTIRLTAAPDTSGRTAPSLLEAATIVLENRDSG